MGPQEESRTPQAEGGRVDRRRFLTGAAATAAAVGGSGVLAAGATAGGRKHHHHHHGHHKHGSGRVPRDRISIQLYTLRQRLALDLQGTLNALGDIGYKRVEHAGFHGRTASEFKAALDAAGLWASSGHTLIPQPFDASAWAASLADARTLGSKYIVHPFFGINFGTGEVVRDAATWAAFAHDMNRAGRMARDAGIRLGYHNHNWEFFRLNNDPSRTAFDVFAAEIDPRYVHLELDLFWAFRGAHDPVDILEELDGLVRQYHVKDLNQAGSFSDVGQGLIDFVRIFREQEVDEYIVERDDAGAPPRTPDDALTTARVSYEYLRNLRIPRGHHHHH